jgi:Uma2 family endonuclease
VPGRTVMLPDLDVGRLVYTYSTGGAEVCLVMPRADRRTNGQVGELLGLAIDRLPLSAFFGWVEVLGWGSCDRANFLCLPGRFVAMQLVDKVSEIQASVMLNVADVKLQVTLEEFDRLCTLNPDLRLERTKDGELVTMTPAGYESSEKNSDLNGQLWYWNRQTGMGRVFDSSGGFVLPNGALKSPDATWIEKSKLVDLPAGVKFPAIIPDFVVELRSDTDRLSDLREKMLEYCDNGVRLGWLINPQDRQVEVYRSGRDVEILEAPATLSGEDVLPGFVLETRSLL